MQLTDFDYNLPKELIAQYPLKERDSAKLLVLNRSRQTIEHRLFRDILDYLAKPDLIVLNNTKVLRARLKGARTSGGEVEVLLLKQKKGKIFDALVKPARLRLGEKVIFNAGEASGIISAKNEVTFQLEGKESVYSLGVMPLPPYIKRSPEDLDDFYYQTVYAKVEGAIAAPTAGLHFTGGLISKIQSCGIDLAYLTLHIGYATFKPVKTDDITKHKMEPEYFKIPEVSLRAIDNARRNKKRIFAVGTTSLRALETYGACGLSQGYTDLFIYPGYEFNVADCLLTNFHLPRTTLFMLVCAFAGKEFIKEAYRQAVSYKYRFYSYGDAMLII